MIARLRPLFFGLLAVLIAAVPAAAAEGVQLISPAALRSDLRLAVETIRSTHPDLKVVDQRALAIRVAEIDRKIVRPMRRDEAWALFATINPALADGHLLIGFPDWRGEAARTLKGGKGLFPFEVTLDRDGIPRIRADLGGRPSALAGARIVRINGRDSRALSGEMLARAHGDTPAFRRALVSERWWFFYLKLYGAPQEFDLELQGTARRRHRVPGGHALPEPLLREDSFERTYACELAADGSARLTLGSFSWPDKARFLSFARGCFARLHAASTRRLVIDISNNSGGDDDLWIEGVMPYIADRPWRTGSRFLRRVLETNEEKGEVKGQIVAGEIETVHTPRADKPLRFGGEVVVRIGALTYSSAVLFANVVQDYGFARLAGKGGAARTRTTGAVRSLDLPASGLFLSYPRFILSRPSGREEPALLRPDLEIAEQALATVSDPQRPETIKCAY